MWCSACQQDVPGVAASVEDASMVCARCGKSLGRREPPRGEFLPRTGKVVSTSESELDSTSLLDLSELEETPDFVELDEWHFEETLNNAERLVRTVQAQDRAVEMLWSNRQGAEHRRLDAARADQHRHRNRRAGTRRARRHDVRPLARPGTGTGRLRLRGGVGRMVNAGTRRKPVATRHAHGVGRASRHVGRFDLAVGRGVAE